jgi:hypothetical protein
MQVEKENTTFDVMLSVKVGKVICDGFGDSDPLVVAMSVIGENMLTQHDDGPFMYEFSIPASYEGDLPYTYRVTVEALPRG